MAKMILAVCSDDSDSIVKGFRNLGFETKRNDPWVIERSARFFFEDDSNPLLQTRRDGSQMNLQKVMEYLNDEDPTVGFPESYFFAMRTAMLLRGLASHLGVGINVAHSWKRHAERAVQELQ